MKKKNLPTDLLEKISIETPSFKQWISNKEIINDTVCSELCKRLKSSRIPLEQGSITDILLRRIFEHAVKESNAEEKIAIILNKRKLSKLDNYSLIEKWENTQKIISQILDKTFTKVLVTLSILATMIIALGILHILQPKALLTIIYYYNKTIELIPKLLNKSQSYGYLSISLFLLVLAVKRLTRIINKEFDRLGLLAGLHGTLSIIALSYDMSLSAFLYDLISGNNDVKMILKQPYLGPLIILIVYIFSKVHDLTSSTSIRLSNATVISESERIRQELLEARDRWVQNVLKV